MKIKTLIVLMLLSAASLTGQGKLVVGYYPSWMKSTYPHTAIQYQYLTYIVHAFIFPNADGSLDLTGFTYYPELIQKAHTNSVGVIISVGGYDVDRTPRFAQVAADPAARKRFATAMRDFCTKNGYDGVDIDWEYPAAAGRSNTTAFFQELHDSLANALVPLTLSIAAPATDWNNGYDWTVMKNILDWVGVMTYDFYGSWTTKIGPNSPLYGNFTQTDQGWIDNSVSFYLGKGVPRSKLLIGTAFYGWKFNGSSMYGSGVGTAQLTYTSIAPLMQQGWTRSWDALARVPYLVNAAQTNVISYDDSMSIVGKMSYIKTQSLGGTIIWALGEDYFASTGQAPLLTALGRSIVTGVQDQSAENLPKSFELLQNYPNPFNPATTISFRLPSAGFVTLKVYDVLGRDIATLVDTRLDAGSHSVRFDAGSLASGVYVYRLTSEGASLIRTMIVLR
ncbi:MAG TPA: glycosyl hydrolase family 18 protein [Bacteroidota bacterium]|nr:glycosyl hydrolase family 18 protein [Bacteroidota bacterium]